MATVAGYTDQEGCSRDCCCSADSPHHTDIGSHWRLSPLYTCAHIRRCCSRTGSTLSEQIQCHYTTIHANKSMHMKKPRLSVCLPVTRSSQNERADPHIHINIINQGHPRRVTDTLELN